METELKRKFGVEIIEFDNLDLKCSDCGERLRGHSHATCPLKIKKQRTRLVMLDLRNNGGRLFILRLVKDAHRLMQMGPKSPTIAALERCIDIEDQLDKLRA